MWEELRQEFQDLDPYNTGFIMADEFKAVLTELCVHLTQHELLTLVDKFDISHDGR
jgi:Ca2+-binding EF-hand superfamily protein